MDKELRNVLKSATLLLVDNNEITLIKFRRILESFVKKVYYASNGKEALKIYKKNKPSFIITDIEMPHMNGLEFVEIIRKKNEYIPIMIVSAFINKEYCLSSIFNNSTFAHKT
jgi:YesN/AraC family two-component response regulator